MSERIIEPCGDQWAVWEGNELIALKDTWEEADDARQNWNRKAWPWASLYDKEQRQKARDAARQSYLRVLY